MYSNFSPRWLIVLLLGTRSECQPITLEIFARSGGALLDNALAATSRNSEKKPLPFFSFFYSYLDVSNNSIQKVSMATSVKITDI